jgi:hypothetical protein
MAEHSALDFRLVVEALFGEDRLPAIEFDSQDPLYVGKSR